MMDANFNSIKVRLERKQDYKDQIEKHLFQFHKGTIRTGNLDGLHLRPQRFQFHKGTIRTDISYLLQSV